MFLSVLNPCKNFTRQSSVVFCFILQQVSVISYVLVNTLAICLTHRHMGVSNINMVLCERVVRSCRVTLSALVERCCFLVVTLCNVIIWIFSPCSPACVSVCTLWYTVYWLVYIGRPKWKRASITVISYTWVILCQIQFNVKIKIILILKISPNYLI